MEIQTKEYIYKKCFFGQMEKLQSVNAVIYSGYGQNWLQMSKKFYLQRNNCAQHLFFCKGQKCPIRDISLNAPPLCYCTHCKSECFPGSTSLYKHILLLPLKRVERLYGSKTHLCRLFSWPGDHSEHAERRQDNTKVKYFLIPLNDDSSHISTETLSDIDVRPEALKKKN